MTRDLEPIVTGLDAATLPFAPETERERRNPAQLAALWVGVIALLFGSVFAAVVVHGGADDSPTDAVQQMFTAVSNGDALGVLASLAPSERNALQGGFVDITKELQRLQVLSPSLDLHKISGINARFDGLQLKARSIGAGVSVVDVVGGTEHSTTDPASLPLGPFVRRFTGSSSGASSQSMPLTDGGTLHIATVKESGHWYVSLAYSVAEAARTAAHKPAPAFGHGLQAKGSPSPEAAVKDMLTAGGSLDVQRLLELLPPDEARAVDDYAPLFLPQAKQAAAQAAQHFHLAVTSVSTTTDTSGDQATVHIAALAVSFAAGQVHGTLSTQGDCTDFSIQGLTAQELADAGLQGGVGHLCQSAATNAARQTLPFLPDLSQVHGGIVTVQRGGSWYISPTRTLLTNVLGLLRALQPADLNRAADFFQQLLNGSSASSGTI